MVAPFLALVSALAPGMTSTQRGEPGAGFTSHAAAQPRDPAGRSARATRLRELGEAWARSGDPGSAIGYFREALAIDPSDARAYEGLTRLYLGRSALRDAADTLRVGLARRPDDAGLWAAQAEVLAALGDLDGVTAALRERVARTPDDPEALAAHAAHAGRRGAWAEALASHRRLLDLAERGAEVGAERLATSRALAEALAVLAGGTDPVRGDAARCPLASPVRSALAGCSLPQPSPEPATSAPDGPRPPPSAPRRTGRLPHSRR